jgi:hypothetical protein
MNTKPQIEIILFTSKEGQHLSLGRSFMKSMNHAEEKDICQDYDSLLVGIKRKYGAKVWAKKIFVDKVKGARESYDLDVVPVLQVGLLGRDKNTLEEAGKESMRRYSGKLELDTVCEYIETLL